MQFEKGFEGLRCIVTTDLSLKDRKFGGWSFKCLCGLETLEITGDVLRSELKDGWHQVKTWQEFAEQWDKELASAKDFIDYQKTLLMLRARRKSKQQGLGMSGGLDSSLILKCGKCGRSYRFNVTLESPLDLAPEMDVIEAFEKLGFNMKDDETKRVLEKSALESHLNGRDELIKELETLKFDRSEIEGFLNELSGIAEKYDGTMKGENSAALVQSVEESLSEIKREMLKENNSDLQRILNTIAARCEELLWVSC